MNILIIGDIVGEPGRLAVRSLLPVLKKREGIDFTVANAENAAGGSGITPKVFAELIGCGIDVITSGDHIFKKKEVLEIINFQDRLLRPANYPKEAPGHGYTVVNSKDKIKVGVVNLAGRVFMEALDCPFRVGMEILNKIKEETPVVIFDVHAEATSEKIALGWYFNGKASVIAGTHTHVQTADERLLPPDNYTAYISDIGMTGGVDSVIGRKTEQILARFLTHTPAHFDVSEENVQLQGVVVEINPSDGRAFAIKRIQEKLK